MNRWTEQLNKHVLRNIIFVEWKNKNVKKKKACKHTFFDIKSFVAYLCANNNE